MRNFSANVRRSFRLHASECFDLPALKASTSLDDVMVDELREDNSTLSMSIDGREGTLHALSKSSKAQKSLCMVQGVKFTATDANESSPTFLFMFNKRFGDVYI